MIIEVKVPAMSAIELAMLNEDLNQVVYNHTGVMGESKLSDKKELESELEKQKELYKGLKELGDERIKKLEDQIDNLEFSNKYLLNKKNQHQIFIGIVAGIIGEERTRELLVDAIEINKKRNE